MKTWNVFVCRNGVSIYLGSVVEKNEEYARCAALNKFSISEDDEDFNELATSADGVMGILTDDEFSVSPA